MNYNCVKCNLIYNDIEKLEDHYTKNNECLNFIKNIYNSTSIYYMQYSLNYIIDENLSKSTSLIHHIIWNLFLTDRISFEKDYKKIIEENKIEYIITIFPDDKININIPIAYINIKYSEHTNEIYIKEYIQIYDKMKEMQTSRKNVLLLCNSGYQRSLPFLCYYLMKYHNEEVKDIYQAIDIILPQIDKKSYLENRENIISNIKSLKIIN